MGLENWEAVTAVWKNTVVSHVHDSLINIRHFTLR